jgi:hypothetical protein
MRNRRARWVLFVALTIGSALFLVGTVLEVIAVTSGNLDKGDTRAAASLGAGFLFVVAVLLALIARRVEHWIHTQAGGISTTTTTTTADFTSAPRSDHQSLWRSRRRNTPHSQRVGIVIFAIVSVAFLAVGISGVVDAHKSADVQRHGIPATGVITDIIEVTHNSRGGSYVTTTLDVRLAPPVLGRDSIVVDTPKSTIDASVGGPIQILVDRSDPGYAELPGEADNTIGTAIGCFFASALTAAMTVVGVITYRRRRREVGAAWSLPAGMPG